MSIDDFTIIRIVLVVKIINEKNELDYNHANYVEKLVAIFIRDKKVQDKKIRKR